MFFAPGMGSNSVPLIQLRIVLLAPDPEGQREHRRQRKTRCAAQLAQCVPYVCQHLIHRAFLSSRAETILLRAHSSTSETKLYGVSLRI